MYRPFRERGQRDFFPLVALESRKKDRRVVFGGVKNVARAAVVKNLIKTIVGTGLGSKYLIAVDEEFFFLASFKIHEKHKAFVRF